MNPRQSANNMEFLPSFGRKRARGLSSAQKENLEVLYQKYGVEIPSESLQKLFNNRYEKIFFEIGFGQGEHLVRNAIQNPDIGFVGCDPFENGVASLLKKIEEEKLENILVYKGDARILLQQFSSHTISRFYVLFPDPWTKKRHHKRRILSEEFIKYLCATQPGELMFATDCEDYMISVLEICDKLGLEHIGDLDSLIIKPEWFLGSRYQQKAEEKGSKCYYNCIKL